MSSFPHFCVDEIIFRNVSHQSGFIFFMIIHFKYSYIRRTFYYSVDSITFWFYLLHKFKMSSSFSGNFRFMEKNRSRIQEPFP